MILHGHLLLLGVYGQHLAHVVGLLVQADALRGHLVVAGFQLADGQYVVDQAGQALRLHHDDVQELVRHLRVIDGPGLQGLHEAAYGGQRRLQLVGHVGGEVRAHLLQAAQLGDVLDDGQRADHAVVAAHRRNIQPQRPVPTAHGGASGHLVGVDAFLAHGLGEHLVQLYVLGNLFDVPVLRVSDDAQQLFGHGGDEDHVQALVHGDDAVLHLGHDRAEHVVAVFLLEYAILNPCDDGVVLDRLGVRFGEILYPRIKIAVRKAI